MGKIDYMQSSVLSLFHENVCKNPAKIAIIDSQGKKINYKALDVYANQIAKKIYETGLPENKRVGISVARSIETIASILATLKTGCTYVPLATDNPLSRMHQICHQAKLDFIIASEDVLPKLPAVSTLFNIDKEKEFIQSLEEYTDLFKLERDPMAVMFTSGTTNLPKGVLISGQSIVNLVKEQNYIEINYTDIFLQLSPIEFDASSFEIWGALLNGATLVLMPFGYPTLANMVEKINTYKISILFITTQLFNIMVDNRLSELDKVDKILFGGEIASKKHVMKFLDSRKYNNYIANIYGPTECTTFSVFYPLTARHDIEYLDSIPIGKPIKGIEVYLEYDKDDDVLAELLISGRGLSAGYLDDAESTHKKFIYLDHIKYYKTGDKVKLNTNNNLIFVGRDDKQVKVRGHRFLPSEIETLAQSYQDVKHAVLLVENVMHNDKYLTLFVVVSCDNFNINYFKKFLCHHLPSYMWVNKITVIDKIPVGITGKIDYDFLLATQSFKKGEIHELVN